MPGRYHPVGSVYRRAGQSHDTGAVPPTPRRLLDGKRSAGGDSAANPINGLFQAEAKALQGAARAILERYGGKVPDRMDELVTLPGVGRKTANVLLGHVFNQPGVVVDTHVRRLSMRLALTRAEEPEQIEEDLQNLRPREDWTAFSMRLILHGRQVCHARAPRCDACSLRDDCPRLSVSSFKPLLEHGG